MDQFIFEYYHEGFFGYSETQLFNYWSIAHLLPLILLGIGIFLIYRYREFFRNWKHEDTFRTLLGALLIFVEASYYWRLLYVGNSQDGTQMITFLPLEVCMWTAYIAAFMFIKKSKHLYDITFYIALSLGLLPLVTPAVIMKVGFGHLRYYTFWLEHLLPILGVFYMTFVHGFRPDYRKIYKPLAVLVVLASVAIYANLHIPGANFMYLSSGTAGDSLANILPESVWARLGIGAGIIAVLFTIISLPQIITEIKQKRAHHTAKE